MWKLTLGYGSSSLRQLFKTIEGTNLNNPVFVYIFYTIVLTLVWVKNSH
jgi:hypothetical protein